MVSGAVLKALILVGVGPFYAGVDVTLYPLGLALTETPSVGVRPRWGGSGMQTDVRGPSVMTRSRHGRVVRIELDSKSFRTRVATRSPAFKVASKDGRLSASGGPPAAVREALSALGAASRWRGVKAEAGAAGIVVTRRSSATASTEQRWMDDLWLAERLAEAARD